MPAPEMPQPTELSVRQFGNDSGAVTRGLPIRQHRFVRTSQARTMFATAPTLDYDELRHDLDTVIGDELSDDSLEESGLRVNESPRAW